MGATKGGSKLWSNIRIGLQGSRVNPIRSSLLSMNPYLCKRKAFPSHKQHPLPSFDPLHGQKMFWLQTRADETHRNPCGFLRVPAVSVDQSTCNPKSEMTSRSLNSYVSNIIALPTASKGGGSDWTRKREPRMSRSSANLLALQRQRRK